MLVLARRGNPVTFYMKLEFTCPIAEIAICTGKSAHSSVSVFTRQWKKGVKVANVDHLRTVQNPNLRT